MDNLYRHYRVIRMAEKAQRVMTDLFHAYMSEPQQLPPHILERRDRVGESQPRVIADYIAGMTDRFALDEHRKLFDPFEKGLSPGAAPGAASAQTLVRSFTSDKMDYVK